MLDFWFVSYLFYYSAGIHKILFFFFNFFLTSWGYIFQNSLGLRGAAPPLTPPQGGSAPYTPPGGSAPGPPGWARFARLCPPPKKNPGSSFSRLDLISGRFHAIIRKNQINTFRLSLFVVISFSANLNLHYISFVGGKNNGNSCSFFFTRLSLYKKREIHFSNWKVLVANWMFLSFFVNYRENTSALHSSFFAFSFIRV